VAQSAVASAASGECVSGQGLAAPESQRRNAFSMEKGYTGSEHGGITCPEPPTRRPSLA